MLGAIIGDMAGSIYEFANTKRMDFPFFSERSTYTDDSIMSLAVAEWLLTDNTHSHDTLERLMVKYADDCPNPMGGYGCRFAQWLFHPDGLERVPYNSWGNGSAMRVSAVGWKFRTLEETEKVAAISASITHDHPEGIKGAQATAAAIFLARTGKSKDEIREYIEARFGYDLGTHTDEIRKVYGWEDSCQGTVPPAIRAFLDSTDFESAVRIAVSLGGDSDTLACITGGIAEAFYGEIPEDIVNAAMEKLPAGYKFVLKLFGQGKDVLINQRCKPEHKNELTRFHEAQNPAYQTALREIREGYKSSHWMWFIFPQIKGLGYSYTSNFYGISSADEAKAYLEDAVLGFRLREISTELLKHSDKSIDSILGDVDSIKLRSSMTLFDAVSPDDVFAEVLNAFFGGKRDEMTLKLL